MEQYGRRNNLKIEGIPTSISGDESEKTTDGILNLTDVALDSPDMVACRRIGRSQDDKSKKMVINIVKCKFCEEALLNRKKLLSVVINDNVTQIKRKSFNDNRNSTSEAVVNTLFTFFYFFYFFDVQIFTQNLL